MSSILKVDTIQDQDGNNIINENANTITIGASGDTITIPSGATFASTGIDDNATSTAITIDSSGSVGIGTSSPSAELHISKSADAGNAEFLIENSFATAGSTDEIVQIQGRFGGFDASYIITGKEADFTTSGNRSSFMSFWTRGAGTLAEAMRINSSGNVGIGTSSPEVPLSVVGLDTQIHFSESADSGGYLMSEAAGQFRISGGAAFKVGNTAWTAKSTEAAIIGHDSGGDIKFFSNTGLTVGNNFTPTERMRIDSSGKVGINTSSPGSELHVVADDVSQSWSAYDGTVLTIENNDTDGCILQTVGRNTATNEIWFGDDDSRNIGRIRYEHSDDGLEFWTNNSERMRINSNGNIGIGTTNSTAAKVYINHEGDVDDNGLYVYSNIGQTVPLVNVIQDGAGSTAPAVYVRNDDADGIALHLYKGSSVITPHTEANSLFIEDSNHAGITIGSGTSKRSSLYFANTTDNDIAKIVVAHDEGSMKFTNNTAERMRIDASGNVLVGTTSLIGDSSRLNISYTYTNSGVGLKSNTTSTHNAIMFTNPNGTVGTITTSGSSTAYNTSSDYRLKENVSYDFDATTRLKQLKPARFNFIADADTTVDGFLAHEVSNVVPEAITGEKDETETKEKVVVNANGNVIAENIEQADWETGKIANEDGNTKYPTDSTWEATKVVPIYQGIDQSKLVPLLVKTIQELEARITALETNQP
jgi:hypothetical protein